MNASVGNPLPAPSPGEQVAMQFGYPTPTGDLIFLVGGAIVLGAVGVFAVGVTAVDSLTKKHAPSPPVTSSQKIVRVGLLGTLIGVGAYAYFAGKQHSSSPTLSPTRKPQVRGAFPPGRGSYQ